MPRRLRIICRSDGQILIPNSGVLDSVSTPVRKTEKEVLLDIVSLYSPVLFIVLGLDFLISIKHQG